MRQKRKKTVSDPACGSGGFFISFEKLNPLAHFYGVDLSLICAKMTALNMWLFDLNADIYHGDSLAMKFLPSGKSGEVGLSMNQKSKNRLCLSQLKRH